MRTWLERALWEVVPRDHRQSERALRRRQLVTVAFVVIGGLVLGFSLRLEPGNVWFYPATFGLAAVWTIGAFASGPLYLGRIAAPTGPRRPVVPPILLGLALVAALRGRRARRPARSRSSTRRSARCSSTPTRARARSWC